jgi:hypothetical protein
MKKGRIFTTEDTENTEEEDRGKRSKQCAPFDRLRERSDHRQGLVP